jgi:hypothetical protein
MTKRHDKMQNKDVQKQLDKGAEEYAKQFMNPTKVDSNEDTKQKKKV